MRTLFFLFAFAASTLLVGQTTASPTGRWITTDDETGEQKSVVEITATGKSFTGKIV